MKNFEYLKAHTVHEATAYLARYGKAASVIAGGTDLITVMKEGVKAPDYIIDLKTVPGLAYVKEGNGELRIGALTLLRDIEDSSLVKTKYQGLAQAAHLVASHQIRNIGTIGGNLCQEVECWYYRKPQFTCYRKDGDQCFAFDGEDKFGAIFVMPGTEKCWAAFPSDLAPMLVAMGAKLKLVGPAGDRLVPVEEFYGELGHNLGPAEILVEVQVPRPLPGLKSTYVKFRLAKGVGFAVSSAAAAIVVEDGRCARVRIALGGVAPVPWRARKAEEVLQAKVIDEKVAEEAADAVIKESKPLKKTVYKEPITRALIKRAILASL